MGWMGGGQARAALRTAGVGLFEISPSARVRVDDSYLDVLGQPRGEAGAEPTASYLELVHAQDRSTLLEQQRRLLSGAVRQVSLHVRMRHHRGGYLWVHWAAHAFEGRIVGSIQDTSRLRGPHEELARRCGQLEALVEHMPLGVVCFSLDVGGGGELLLQWANPAARRLAPLDWSAGRPARELFPGATEEDFEKRRAVARGGPAFTESKRHYEDGTIRGAFDTTFFNSGPGELTGIFVDVTDQVRTHDELRRSNESLEQFAYGIAHDLREPVRAVGAYSELVEQSLEAPPPQVASHLRLIREGAARMSSLIEDLLGYARVGRARAKDPIDTNAVVSDVLRDFALAIAESGAEIVVGRLPSVVCLPAELRQVLSNLVGNALKFRGASSPRVEIDAARTADGKWEFRITDNGIGIEPDRVQDAFRLFGRLHGRERYPGNGVGLALCKRIIEQNGGQIAIESAPGAGSTVSFTLQ